MFYLEKVIAVIEKEKYKEAVGALGEKLRAQGMEFVCFAVQEFPEDSVQNCTGDTAYGNAGRMADIQELPVLWLSDSSACVTALRKAGHAVLAFLHDDNRDRDFSGAWYACEEPQELDAGYLDRVFRRYRKLPWDILQTERCLVRETVPEDAEAFYRIYQEPAITRYTEGLLPDIEQERQYIQDYIDKVYRFYDCGIWTIIKADTDEVIGRAGLTFREGYEVPEIGFVIGTPWQRKGYAEEVCRAILEYGREELGFKVVQAFVKPENRASLALCRKLGLEKAGEVLLEKEVHWQLVGT